MNKRQNKKIPSKIKAEIISESLMPGCIVSELALKHDVSKQIIYEWRKEFQANHSQFGTSVDAANRFIELPIINSKSCVLEKASLVFRDFSLVLEGRIHTSSLLSILKILEESC